MRSKKIRRELEAHRARAVAPLVWEPLPGWTLGPGWPVPPDVFTPHDDHGDIDTAAMAKTTRAQYLAVIAAAVADGERGQHNLEPEKLERSWQAFLHYRAGVHSPTCGCYAGQPKQDPAPPPPKPTPVNPVAEVWGGEPSVNPCDR